MLTARFAAIGLNHSSGGLFRASPDVRRRHERHHEISPNAGDYFLYNLLELREMPYHAGMTEQRGHPRAAARPNGPADGNPPPGILIRLADQAEYEAVGELSDAAYSHDYVISDWYRASLREVAARAAEHEVWVG